MDPLSLVVIAAAACAFGAISKRAERSPLTPPLFFLAVGLFAGPAGLGWIPLDLERAWIHGLAEITLVLVLFTDAARIDLACLRREESLPTRLLLLGLPLTIVAGAAAALLIFTDLSPFAAFLIAAILAPTDAALGQAVVSNETVPLRIRQTLNAESGLNDGIALPVVLIFAALAAAPAANHAQRDPVDWLRFALLALTLGPLVGGLVGYVGGRIVSSARKHGWINDAFQRIAGLALALLAFAGAETIGGNGFIAAFVAGLTIGNTARDICTYLHEFGEAEGQLLTLLVFLLFGAAIAPAAIAHATPAVWLYALLSLTLVRMIPVALALLGAGLRRPSVAFLGWFGPRGLASILFALLVVEQGELGNRGDFVETVVFTTVLASTILHGITAYPLASRYGAWVGSLPPDHPEHAEVGDMPVRMRHGSAG